MKDKELRMSDIFELPVSQLSRSIARFQIKPNFDDSVTGYDAIDEAVNNHDSMLDRISELDSQKAASDKLTQEIYNLMSKSWQVGFDTEGEKVIPDYIKTLLDVIERRGREVEELKSKLNKE